MVKRTNLKISTCAMMIQTQNENKGNTKYRAERICECECVKWKWGSVNCICIHMSVMKLTYYNWSSKLEAG